MAKRRRQIDPLYTAARLTETDLGEWSDWEHWQDVEEWQSINEGLRNNAVDPADADHSTADPPWVDEVTRRLRRYGLGADH